MKEFDVVVVGGGASGFFAAINCKINHPELSVVLLEKSGKWLSKVKVSGGGRCNVTNAEDKLSDFLKNYPRGKNFLKKAFTVFGPKETIEWFRRQGLELKTESDNRMFPVSNSSQAVIDLFMHLVQELKINLRKNTSLEGLEKKGNGWLLRLQEGSIVAKKVIVALGGMSKTEHAKWSQELNLEIVSPVPSLFTFKTLEKQITALMGLSKDEVGVRITGVKRKENGPVLITHWGFSGPAIIKSSAWLARELHAKKYVFEVAINWMNEGNEEEVIQLLSEQRKVLKNVKLNFPQRLWDYLLIRAHADPERVFAEMSKKDQFRLVNTLINDSYQISGKTTFKEEFVTAGGIALNEVNPKTMESHQHKGLFFCGEVLDVDGVTGGFNFQAAWTTGYLAGVSAAKDY